MTQRIALTEDLTIYHVLDLKQRLVEALDQNETIELDLARVGQIDSAGLQLLIFAKREAGRLGRTVDIVAHSAVVQETIEFCNLAALFGDPLVITAR